MLPLLLFARLATGKDQALIAPLSQGAEPAVPTGRANAPALEVTSPQVVAAPVAVPAVQTSQRRIELLSTPPDVDAHAYAILDRGCGQWIAVKNPNERMPPASLTKIITAMVVRSRSNLDDTVLINVSGKRMAAKGSSVMGIEPGMLLSVRDLLNGLFLASGNDAAEALAQYIAGNDDAFAALMNQAAAQLHMVDTHFSNPHGLDDANLYSSASDLALAGSAFLNDPILTQISSTPEYMPNWKGAVLKNGNRLLQSYPGAFGVKIGFTERAHQTLVAAAERDGRQIVVSLLKTEDRYADAEALLDWAFANSKASC